MSWKHCANKFNLSHTLFLSLSEIVLLFVYFFERFLSNSMHFPCVKLFWSNTKSSNCSLYALAFFRRLFCIRRLYCAKWRMQFSWNVLMMFTTNSRIQCMLHLWSEPNNNKISPSIGILSMSVLQIMSSYLIINPLDRWFHWKIKLFVEHSRYKLFAITLFNMMRQKYPSIFIHLYDCVRRHVHILLENTEREYIKSGRDK